MMSYYIRKAQNDWCPYKDTRIWRKTETWGCESIKTETHKKAISQITPTVVSHHQKVGRSKRKFLLSIACGRMALLTPEYLTLSLQNCEINHMCCYKHSLSEWSLLGQPRKLKTGSTSVKFAFNWRQKGNPYTPITIGHSQPHDRRGLCTWKSTFDVIYTIYILNWTWNTDYLLKTSWRVKLEKDLLVVGKTGNIMISI